MKKFLGLLGVLLILSSQIFAGVVKKTKAEVDFTKFGKFTSIQSVKIAEMKKATNSQNKFKGRGIMGKLAGKFALKSGQTGEIIDLPEMKIYTMDNKKKEYRVSPIKKITEEEKSEEPTPEKEYKEEKEESNIKIIRSEFKVDETGESRTINQFPSKKYTVNWTTEWENVETGEKGTTRLFTIVWTTPLTGTIKQCQDEEMSFSREYMSRIGLDLDEIQQEILGTNWLSLLTSISHEKGSPSHNVSQFGEEMKKIKGYPVIIDGKFYSSKQGGKEEAESPDVKKFFGRFAKKAMKNKSKNEDVQKPAFSYYNELIEFILADVGADEFQVRADYKKKG